MGALTIIGESIFKILFYLIYSIFSGFTAYFLVISKESFRRQRVIDLKSGISFAFAVVYAVVLSALTSFDLVFVNAGRILGIAVTLVAGYHYGYMGGVLCGALTTCGIFLSSKDAGMPFVLLSVAGLISGYIHRRSMGAIAILFNAVSILFIIMTGQTKPSKIKGFRDTDLVLLLVLNASNSVQMDRMAPFYTQYCL